MTNNIINNNNIMLISHLYRSAHEF